MYEKIKDELKGIKKEIKDLKEETLLRDKRIKFLEDVIKELYKKNAERNVNKFFG